MEGSDYLYATSMVAHEVIGTTDECTALDAAQGAAESAGWITLGVTYLHHHGEGVWEVQHYAMPADTDPATVAAAIAWGEANNLW
jgi:hypothetical protein